MDSLEHHTSIGHDEDVAEECQSHTKRRGHGARGRRSVALLVPLVGRHGDRDLALLDGLLELWYLEGGDLLIREVAGEGRVDVGL